MQSFISFDHMQQLLSELCDELPEVFFNELNLGVILSEALKLNDASTADRPLYILGHYIRSQMGRQIVIYYGSFRAVYAHLDEAQLVKQLRHTLRHEFRHHVEYLAGERGLELEDKRHLIRLLGGAR